MTAPVRRSGASGAIFGLFGLLFAVQFVHRPAAGPADPRRSWASWAALIAINLLFGILVPGIDNWAHIGGLVAGLWIGRPASRPRRPRRCARCGCGPGRRLAPRCPAFGRRRRSRGRVAGIAALLAVLRPAMGGRLRLGGLVPERCIPRVGRAAVDRRLRRQGAGIGQAGVPAMLRGLLAAHGSTDVSRLAGGRVAAGPARPPSLEATSTGLVAEAVAAQVEAGMGLVTDGQVRWPDPVDAVLRGARRTATPGPDGFLVRAWRATAVSGTGSRGGIVVAQALPGPSLARAVGGGSDLVRRPRRRRPAIRALGRPAGCPRGQSWSEPAAIIDPARTRADAVHAGPARLFSVVADVADAPPPAVHAMLPITGGSAHEAGAGDHLRGAVPVLPVRPRRRSRQLAPRARGPGRPGDRVRGALAWALATWSSTRRRSSSGPREYAASANGRGIDAGGPVRTRRRWRTWTRPRRACALAALAPSGGPRRDAAGRGGRGGPRPACGQPRADAGTAGRYPEQRRRSSAAGSAGRRSPRPAASPEVRSEHLLLARVRRHARRQGRRARVPRGRRRLGDRRRRPPLPRCHRRPVVRERRASGAREIADAVAAQMRRLSAYSSFGAYTTEPTVQLAARIAALAPVADAAVFFASRRVGGGRDGRQAGPPLLGRHGPAGQAGHRLARARYHGMAAFGTSLAGIPLNKAGYGTLVGDVVHVGAHDLDALETLFAARAPEIAAFIARAGHRRRRRDPARGRLLRRTSSSCAGSSTCCSSPTR